MKRNFMSRLFSLITFLTILCSCQNDYFPEQEHYNNSGKFKVTSKRISLSQSKHKAKLIPELEKIETELKSQLKTSSSGTQYGEFTLDTDDIVFIENGPNYHTYTFHIIRDNSSQNSPVENLVFTPLTDGTYRKLLVTYNFTPEEKQIIRNGGEVDTKGKSTVTVLGNGTLSPLTGKSQSCGYVEATAYTWCSEGIHHNGETSSCTADVKSHAITVYLWKCESYDDGSGNTGGGSYPGSGDGGAGGGTGSGEPWDGTWVCPEPQVLTGPQDPSTDIGDGSCYGVPTEPNLGSPTNNPCEKIKSQRENTEFSNNIADLQTKTNLKKETGYIQKWGGTYEYKDNASATDEANSLSLPEVATNTYIKGYAHTHVDDYEYIDVNGETVKRLGVKILSPADVGYFMDLVQNAQTNGQPLGDVYGIMISSMKNYQLRFTGNQYQIKTFTDEQIKTHRKAYTEFMKPYIDNPKKLELGFLQYISEKMNLKGITLYRMNADGTTTEIKLNADKTDTIETNCPN